MAKRSKRFQAAGKRKAKVRGIFVEHVRRDRLLQLYEGRCGICGQFVNPRTFNIDHILPASRGGEHSYANCQPAHPSCNSAKADMTIEEFDRFWPVKGKRRKNSYTNRHGLGLRKRIGYAPARAA